MENYEKLEETKTLAEFDQSPDSPAVKKVLGGKSQRIDLTSSISMGARIAKSQENGTRVSEEKKVDASIDGGGGSGDDLNIPLKELSPRKNLGVRKAIDKECFADDSEMEKGAKDCTLGDKMGGSSVGNMVDADGVDHSKLVVDHDSGGKNLKSLGRRGRKSKFKAGERSNSDEKLIADMLSSISQRTRNRVPMGKNEDIGDMDVADEGSDVGDEDDQDNRFSVGDFVWGKIKSHPWWPGRIYDPSNASEFALKYKHEGLLLVAYFGDGTFAWCDPSQLKPFGENFEEMSKQSNLKTFVNSVEEAVNEFSRLIELQITCSCAREKIQSSLQVVLNAGVKEGVLVPETGVEVFSAAQFEPAAMLADMRRLAIFVSVANKLELSVLKSQLLVFYLVKGSYTLPIHYEPLEIEDLVDKNGVSREVSFRGPDDGDWFVSPADHLVTANRPQTPLDISQERRKERSIAELLGRDTKVQLLQNSADRTQGDMRSGKAVVKPGKKKRKVVEEVDGDESGISKDEESSGKLVPKSGRKRKKLIDEDQSHIAHNLMVTRSRTREKKGSARPTTTKEKASSEKEDDGEEKIPRKASVGLKIDHCLGSIEGLESISPRERKKSKYLSPPYTSPRQKQRNSSFQVVSEAGGLEFSDVARMGERMSKAAGKLVGSPPMVKCSAETFQKSSKGFGSKDEKTDHPDRETCSPSGSVKRIESLNNVLCEIRSAARDPLYLRKDQSFDSMREFLSSYRSSKYKNEANYKLYKKSMADHRKTKRNSSDAKLKSAGKVLNQVHHYTSEPKTLRNATMREQKSLSKAEHEEFNESTSSAALLVTFSAEISLPSKEDIIKMYSKFGPLDESKTEAIPESSTVKIVFVKSSDAETAMDSMQKSSPFGAANVGCKIQHLTAAYKAKKANAQNKKKMKSSGTQDVKSVDEHLSLAPENEPLAVIFIKQKLEEMTSMLAQTDGKMSEETKSKLENEVKELLKKVKMMTAASS